MGGSSKQTIGYKYLLGVHAILTHGPVDACTRLSFDKKEAWSGISTGGPIVVNAPGLFGGQEREGGVSGTVDFMPGAADQTQNAYLAGFLDAPVPAFRGVAGLVFRNFYWGNNPYLKVFSARLQRIHIRDDGDEQWYDEKAAVGGTLVSALATWNETMGSFYTDYTVQFGDLTDIMPAGNSIVYEAGGYAATQLTRNLPIPAESGFRSFRFRFISGDPSGLATIVSLDRIIGSGFTDVCRVYLGPFVEVSFNGSGGQFLKPDPLDAGILYTFELVYDSITGQGIASLYNSGMVLIDDHTFSGSPGEIVADQLRFDSTVSRPDLTVLDISYTYNGQDYVGANDMNPAHIVRECLTNRNWGLGYGDEDIDDTSFTIAADTLFDEGMGISLLWDRQIPIEDFIKEIMRHIDATLYVSSRGSAAGKFVLKLIRNDYDYDFLPILNQDVIDSVDSWKQTSFGELVNSITVNYHDPERNDTASVTISDPALVAEQAAIINTTQHYEGFTKRDLAARVAARDLAALSRPLYTGQFNCHYSAAKDLEPGDAVRLEYDFGDDNEEISINIVVRVIDADRGDGRSNTVKLTVTQDVFALPTVTYLGEEEDGWVNPVQPPIPADPEIALEAPYRELVQRLSSSVADGILTDNPDAGFVAAAAGRTGGAINARAVADAGSGYVDYGALDFCPHAKIVAGLDQLETSVELSDYAGLAEVNNGTYALLNGEAIVVSDISGSPPILTFERAVMDTVPDLHDADDQIFFLDEYTAESPTEYNTSESIDVKVLPVTGLGQLAEEDATALTVVMNNRAIRPYPPGNLRISGQSYPASRSGPLEVTWAHRDRLLQADQLIPHTDGNIGPEAGTTYTVRYYLDAVLDHTESGITGTAATPYTMSGDGVVRVEVESVRDSYVSWQAAHSTFTYTINEARITDAADTRITDSGDRRIKD